ncbi:MAG: disulfide bond formation protein B [Roseobacter sp.]
MTHARLTTIAILGSAGLLAGAFIFQMLGFAPCQMCIWQRYPHAVAVGIGLTALVTHQNWLLLIGALAAATTSVIGFFHAGVEQGWWQGITSCSAGPIDSLSADDLLDQIMSAPLVRCDDIPWEFIGISMAGWNGLISFGLVLCWFLAFRRAE